MVPNNVTVLDTLYKTTTKIIVCRCNQIDEELIIEMMDRETSRSLVVTKKKLKKQTRMTNWEALSQCIPRFN